MIQDSNARTALHVAATCGSLEVVSVMCKYENCGISPVDVFGRSPLDDARMMDNRPVASLLEQAGALSGSDPQLEGAPFTTSCLHLHQLACRSESIVLRRDMMDQGRNLPQYLGVAL